LVLEFPLFFLDLWLLEPLFLLPLAESLAGPAAFGALFGCRWVLFVTLSNCFVDEALDF
jgi:hypothetical protein